MQKQDYRKTKNFDGISGYLNNDIPHDNPVEAPDSDKRVS